MQADSPPAAQPPPQAGFKAVLLEGAVVAVIGAILAFAANALSPRGLNLARDHFPGAVRISPAAVATNLPSTGSSTNVPAPSPAELVAARLQAKNLQVVDRGRLRQLFQDPRYPHDQVVFVDARDDTHYQAGHIPGARQFDHYRAPDYLANVLPVCLTAEQIVVYCDGGDCEDSEFAAVMLRETGVPNERLSVYAGGFTDWQTNGLPVELGAHLSGHLRPTTK